MVRVYASKIIADAYAFLRDTYRQSPRGHRIEIAVDKRFKWNGEDVIIRQTSTERISVQRTDGSYISFLRQQFEQFVSSGEMEPDEQTTEAAELYQVAQARLLTASKEELEQANRYADIIRCLLEGQDIPEDIELPQDRTLRDLKAKYRKAQRQYGFGYL